MKKILISVCLLLGVLCSRAAFAEEAAPEAPPVETPKIQIAILLDTSGSMDGLIEQAKSLLWEIVNDFTKVKQKGVSPDLEVALYHYGNDGLDAKTGYIQQLTPFTTDLDLVSEKLFALRTNGGYEYCGAVISEAVKELKWSDRRDDLRLIFIAGNEEFTQEPGQHRRYYPQLQQQAPMPQQAAQQVTQQAAQPAEAPDPQQATEPEYVTACKAAAGKHIIVNTIHCGDEEEGRRTKWEDGALLTDGKYLVINQNQAVVAISAPQDKRLAELNSELNGTYIAYGKQGQYGAMNQVAQDMNNASVIAGRAAAKASKFYRNDAWDLVDATQGEDFDIEKVETEDLPEAMQKMTLEEKKAYVAGQTEKRAKIQEEITKLSKERNDYIAAERQRMAEEEGFEDASLEAKAMPAMRELAEDAFFDYEE